MKKILIILLSIFIVSFFPEIKASPYSYLYTYQLYFMEPFLPEDLNVISEDITIKHQKPSNYLSLSYNDETKLEYTSSLNVVNNGPARDIKIVVPYYDYYDSSVYSKVNLKLNNNQQNPLVGYDNQGEYILPYLNYSKSYNKRYKTSDLKNNFLGYLYKFSEKEEEGDIPYVEFTHSLTSNRLISSANLEKHRLIYYDTYVFGYVAKDNELLSLNKKLTFSKEVNVIYSEDEIYFNDLATILFKNKPYYDNAKIILTMLLDDYDGNDYLTYNSLMKKIEDTRHLAYYTYEFVLPAGDSEIRINYAYPYIVDPHNQYGVRTNIITKSSQYKENISSYKITYYMEDPFTTFESDSFIGEEGTNKYSFNGTSVPSYNLSFEIMNENEGFIPHQTDYFYLLLAFMVIILPIAFIVGIIVVVIVLVVRKKKKLRH